MLNAIKTYCDNETVKNGLFLLDMPTGFGKTYSVLKYIYKASLDEKNADKKFFFVTTLKKNLPISEMKEHFEKENKLTEFKEKFLFIDSNADCVVNNLTLELIDSIPDNITKTAEYREFAQDVKFIQDKGNDTNIDVKRIVLKTKEDLRLKSEPNFRMYVSNLLRNRFPTIQARLQAIKTSTEWQWVGKLYPAVFTRDKQIIFMSINKFLSRNATIVEPSYMFYNSDIINEAIIFIDEFDATKETVLNNIIQNGLRDRIDYLDLFKDIYAALQIEEFPSALTTASQNRIKSEYANQSLQSIIDGFKVKAEELHNKYYLKYSYRTQEDDTRSQNFLFQDHVFHSILNGHKKFIAVRHDTRSRQNLIDFTEKKPDGASDNIFVVLGKLRGFISFFQRGVNVLAINYMQLKQENRRPNEDDFTRESAIRSVLAEFRLSKAHIDYLTSAILASSRKTSNLALQDFDLTFFEKGFRYYSFENDSFHDMQSQIMMCAFQNTPEKILLRFCEKAKIVGISATATLPSIVGNYDIGYIKSRLGDAFHTLNSDERNSLRSQFGEHTKEYDKIDIHAEFISGRVANEYSVHSWEKVFDDMELAENIYNTVEQRLLYDNNDYNKKRYVRVALAYKQFVVHDDIQSFLCMLTKHPRKNDNVLDIGLLNKIFDYIANENGKPKLISKNTVIQLDGEEYDNTKDEIISKLSNGNKLFVISVYQTMGAGQNIQYPIPKTLTNTLIKTNVYSSRNEKDFDAIYLDKPTHVLVNLDNGLAEESFVKFIFQMEYLQESHEISSETAITQIRKAFRTFSAQVKVNNIYTDNIYKKKSVALLITRTIIQAIGRICRTNVKNPNIYIFADESIAEYIDTSVEKNRLLNPEFIQLLQAAKAVSEHEYDEGSPEFAASLLSVRVNTFINNILREDWNDDRIKKWTKLREITLQYPTISEEEANSDFLFKNLYIKQPVKSNVLFYKQQEDFSSIDVSFTPHCDFKNEVSEASVRLNSLMQILSVKDYFTCRNWATAFVPNDYILSPALFNNIYKGALGEAIGCYLLRSLLNIKLVSINDTDIFEFFDFVVSDSSIYVDFKHWQDSTQFDRDNMLNKIFDKLKKCNGKCALIINILSENTGTVKKTDKGDMSVIEVPSLYYGQEPKLNENALMKIRRYINEFSNQD